MMVGEWLFTVLACLAMAIVAGLLLYFFIKDFIMTSWSKWRPDEKRAMIIAFLLGFAFMLLTIMAARAHENPTDWIGQERRTNADGVLCCGKGDCFPFTAQQMKITPEGYTFPDGHFAPFNKAAPSADGFYWKCVWGGETKCVFAPIGGV